MIKNAEEFKQLRESENPEDYYRASHEEANKEVWLDVLDKYPDMAFWVAQNKTVPIEILEILVSHPDSNVRNMVARKRKLPERLMLQLTDDIDESVRFALVSNAKASKVILEKLSKDVWSNVSEAAKERLAHLQLHPVGSSDSVVVTSFIGIKKD
jgi:hypothetical protein